jgi:hypothetical protein
MPMTPQAPGDLLHRADPTTPGASAPCVEELHRPFEARVLPEPLEVLAEQMSPDALEVVFQDLLEPDFLMVCVLLRSLEQTPPGLCENRFVASAAEAGFARRFPVGTLAGFGMADGSTV